MARSSRRLRAQARGLAPSASVAARPARRARGRAAYLAGSRTPPDDRSRGALPRRAGTSQGRGPSLHRSRRPRGGRPRRAASRAASACPSPRHRARAPRRSRARRDAVRSSEIRVRTRAAETRARRGRRSTSAASRASRAEQRPRGREWRGQCNRRWRRARGCWTWRARSDARAKTALERFRALARARGCPGQREGCPAPCSPKAESPRDRNSVALRRRGGSERERARSCSHLQ